MVGTRGSVHRNTPAKQHHRDRGDHEDHAPAEQLRDEAADRAGSEDPDQQAAHHGADDAPALVLAGERRGHRDDDLREDRGHAEDGDREREHREARRRGGQPEAGSSDQQHRRDQAPALEQVAERNQQRQPDHVAGLGDRDQQARGAVRHREGVGDRVQQRLGVVEVRHRRPASEREQQNERPADAGAELC